MPRRTKCRHCKTRKCNRPRGLCWTCYYTPEVRASYGPISKFGRRGNGLTELLPPLESTRAVAGTEEKIALMAERVARGEEARHVMDNREIMLRPGKSNRERENGKVVEKYEAALRKHMAKVAHT